MAKSESTPVKSSKKGTQETKLSPEQDVAGLEPGEFKPEDFKPLMETFEADPKEHCSIICGNKVLFLGNGIAEITITKVE